MWFDDCNKQQALLLVYNSRCRDSQLTCELDVYSPVQVHTLF